MNGLTHDQINEILRKLQEEANREVQRGGDVLGGYYDAGEFVGLSFAAQLIVDIALGREK